jgi:hypothetical protein
VAFRLLDAPKVKACLRGTTAPLVVVESGQIYESAVLHCHDGIRPEAYRRAARVQVCGMQRHGWRHIPTPEFTMPKVG